MIASARHPFLVVHPVHVGNLRRIAQFGFPEPDPDEIVALHHRIDLYTRLRRNVVLAWDMRAAAFLVELHSVIAAAHLVALQRRDRERCIAMRTAILHRDCATRLRPPQDHGLVEKSACQNVMPYLLRESGDLPRILEPHGRSSLVARSHNSQVRSSLLARPAGAQLHRHHSLCSVSPTARRPRIAKNSKRKVGPKPAKVRQSLEKIRSLNSRKNS